MHQPIKNQVRHLPHVPAILELPKVLREMLRADVNVRPVDAALQHRPEAFNAVHGRAALADIFVFAVVAGQVAIPRATNLNWRVLYL